MTNHKIAPEIISAVAVSTSGAPNRTVEINNGKCAKPREEAMENIPPPMLPSQDFLGEIRSNRRCLPISEPTQ